MKPLSTTAIASFWPILGASSLALALPLLGTLGDGPAFFVAHAASGTDIALFALAVYLIVPIVLFSLLRLCKLLAGETAAQILLAIIIALASGIWGLSFLKAVPTTVAAGLASCIGLAVGWAYYLDKQVRPLLRILGMVSVAIPVYFLFFTPVKSMLGTSDPVEFVEPSAAAEIPVIMLVLDELPMPALLQSPDDIDAVRFPNFYRLQQMSTWYRNTTTVSTHTHMAISGILGGIRPSRETLPIPSQISQNIFSMLAPSHTVRAIESVSQLCIPTQCESLSDDLSVVFNLQDMASDARYVWLHAILPLQYSAEHLPTLGGKWRGFGSNEAQRSNASGNTINTAMTDGFDAKNKAQWNAFIDNMGNSGPTLNYLHLGLPHHPWIYLPDGRLYNGRETPATTYTHDWKNRPPLVRQASLRFGLQMEYVDTLIGQMLDALSEAGRLESSMVIVVSDHGLAIAPKEKRRKPTKNTFADIALVPLFIKYPQQTLGAIDDRPVETIDILPTIANTLNILLKDTINGQALNDPQWKAPKRSVFEADADIANIDQALSLSSALARFHDAVPPGKTALDSWGQASGGKYFGNEPGANVPSAPDRSLVLDRPEWYENTQLDSGFLPARLTGAIDGVPGGTPVYISLNGKIAGGNVTYNKHGAVSVMLSPAAFRNGGNALSAYIEENGVLTKISIASRDAAKKWAIEIAGDVFISITDAQGKQYRVDESKTGSAVISRNAPLAAIVGTAFDDQLNVTPEHLLLVNGNSIVADNFKAFLGREAKNQMARGLVSAFNVEITHERVPTNGELTVLAIWNDGTFLPIPVTDNTALFR